MNIATNRRVFLQQATALSVAASGLSLYGAESSPKRVAGIVTIYRRNSHADVLLSKILQGWKEDGGPGPKLKLVSLYVDQFPNDDLSVELAKKYGFRLCQSIPEALTLGTNQLAVDGVMSIGEHGDYPYNEKGQHLYPRRRFFDEICGTMEKCQQVVPVFNDKHPGPEWADAQWMAERARELNVPWMAGSSLPVGYRDPHVTLPFGAQLQSSVAVGYSGLDIYGFHTLDVMQSILERRAPRDTESKSGIGKPFEKPFERGVRWVQSLPVRDLGKLLETGVIDPEVLDAALAASKTDRQTILDAPPDDGAIFLIQYRDGFLAPAIMLAGKAQAISMAFQIPGGSVTATRMEERVEPRYPHFACLLKGIEQMFLTGRPAYPVERTLLSAGILDGLLSSRHSGGQRIDTPHLEIEYQPTDYPFGDKIAF
ncbi:MAG: hypothetical protein MUC83_03070 [Pirellula sp.]|jgi:hypothetical protein|nr:hypothetical protein [Pirellula sp.]